MRGKFITIFPAVILQGSLSVEVRNRLVGVDANQHVADVGVDEIILEAFFQVVKNGIVRNGG